MTLDAYLLQDGEEGFVHMPETRNEKITGDKATLEIKDKDTKDDKWMSFPFVKQDGVWKMAFEEYMKELPQRLKEEIEKQTNTSTNKSKAEPKE